MTIDDKIENLIREIAIRHGVPLSRDDPIMILQTINTQLIRESHAAQQEILNLFRSDLELAVHRWNEDAKGKAERTLNAALTASKETMTKGMQEGSKVAAEAVRHEIETAINRFYIPIREAQRISYINMITAGITLFSTVVVFFIYWLIL